MKGCFLMIKVRIKELMKRLMCLEVLFKDGIEKIF